MSHNINSTEDLYKMLDNKGVGVVWDDFYDKRDRPAPFIVQNELPDENLASLIEDNEDIKHALEIGCGEGRNAIYLASKGLTVTAIDISHVAINNAKEIASKKQLNVKFIDDNMFTHDFQSDKFEFVYDSGMFHHLAPHRRLSYLEIIDKVLIKNGYFALTCFAWGENCADEVDDWEFYDEPFRAGVAFTQDRLRDFFGKKFEVIYIRKYKDGVKDTIQGLGFLWVCLFKKR